jgi:DNA-binding NarL/FixJ family response regulator
MNALAQTAPLRIVTVEDDPRFRKSFALLLKTVPGFTHQASHSSAEPLLAEARKARTQGVLPSFDLVLTDLGLPGLDGIGLTRELKSLFPALRVIVLSVFEDPANVLAAICSGADGYLLKGSSPDEIVAGLQQIRCDRAPLSSALASTMLQFVRESHRLTQSGVRLPKDLGLSQRQLDVLRGLVDGLSYSEIGTRLAISTETVRGHVHNIYTTLQVRNVAEAVRFAIKHGLA